MLMDPAQRGGFGERQVPSFGVRVLAALSAHPGPIFGMKHAQNRRAGLFCSLPRPSVLRPVPGHVASSHERFVGEWMNECFPWIRPWMLTPEDTKKPL